MIDITKFRTPGDPEEYPNHELEPRTDAVSLMYDEKLLYLASECISTARHALDTLKECPEGDHELMEKDSIAWLRNYLMQLAKRTAQHAAGILDFFEIRPPRENDGKVTENLDRILLEKVSPEMQRVYRGLLYVLDPVNPDRYVSIGRKSSRVYTLACAVVDTAICNPGKPIRVPNLDNGTTDLKTAVADIVATVCKGQPEARDWFRLQKCGQVKAYGDVKYSEYYLYMLTYVLPMESEDE